MSEQRLGSATACMWSRFSDPPYGAVVSGRSSFHRQGSRRAARRSTSCSISGGVEIVVDEQGGPPRPYGRITEAGMSRPAGQRSRRRAADAGGATRDRLAGWSRRGRCRSRPAAAPAVPRSRRRASRRAKGSWRIEAKTSSRSVQMSRRPSPSKSTANCRKLDGMNWHLAHGAGPGAGHRPPGRTPPWSRILSAAISSLRKIGAAASVIGERRERADHRVPPVCRP